MWCSGDLEIVYRFQEQCVTNKHILMDLIKKIQTEARVTQEHCNFETSNDIKDESIKIIPEIEIKKEVEECKSEEEMKEPPGTL